MKILGIIFLVFAGGMVGTIFWRRSLEHIKFLEAYISLILEIKTEIKYTQKTLFQILKGYGSGTGDIVVNISVYIPEHLDKDEKSKIESLNDSKHIQPTDNIKNKIFRAFRNYFNK